jgi:RNA polymerase sigma-70 factor (ECF subfamily)
MLIEPRSDPTGLFDVRYAAYLAAIADLRPRLHRYCARMTGSVLDGEDVVQDALFEAYRKIDQLDDTSAIRPWLFRIAHNRCVDLLRHRQVRERAEAGYAEEDIVLPVESSVGTGSAIERLVITLPPKERACVLLKDVFDYSLEEIADLVGSTVGGVKAALSRARQKLDARSAPRVVAARRRPDPERARLLQRYVELFDRRDWDGVRALCSDDAQLRVADCFRGQLAESPYFTEYERAERPWRAVLGEVDGEQVVLVLNRTDDGWHPDHVVRIHADAGVVRRIADYYACPWMLPSASSILVDRVENPR